MRPARVFLPRVFVCATMIGFCAAASVQAASIHTVNWSGSNSFNTGTITWDHAFRANQLTDIYGTGRYEACCSSGSTNFTLDLRLNDTWATVFQWSTTGDETTHLLGDLVPRPTDPHVITFAKSLVSGIRLASNPSGGKNDPNFTNFKFTSYLSRDEYYDAHKSEYKDHDDYLKCDDYDNYVKNVTSFVFDDKTSPASGPPLHPTPLPGALPLMATALGGFFIALYRRRVRR